jgi:hypothetical protein
MAMLNPQKVMKKMFYLCERARKKERERFFTPLQWCAFIACAVGEGCVYCACGGGSGSGLHAFGEREKRKKDSAFLLIEKKK